MSGSAYPLDWPVNWPRSRVHERARFSDRWTVSKGVSETLAELGRMGVADWTVVVSSDITLRLDGLPRSGQPAPRDPGVAVYFKLRGEPHVLACDKWDKVAHNLAAISKHVAALRGMDRWGVGTAEQAFAGYAIAEHASEPARSWREVLEFGQLETVNRGEVTRNFARLAKERHPDTGGDSAQFIERA